MPEQTNLIPIATLLPFASERGTPSSNSDECEEEEMISLPYRMMLPFFSFVTLEVTKEPCL